MLNKMNCLSFVEMIFSFYNFQIRCWIIVCCCFISFQTFAFVIIIMIVKGFEWWFLYCPSQCTECISTINQNVWQIPIGTQKKWRDIFSFRFAGRANTFMFNTRWVKWCCTRFARLNSTVQVLFACETFCWMVRFAQSSCIVVDVMVGQWISFEVTENLIRSKMVHTTSDIKFYLFENK